MFGFVFPFFFFFECPRLWKVFLLIWCHKWWFLSMHENFNMWSVNGEFEICILAHVCLHVWPPLLTKMCQVIPTPRWNNCLWVHAICISLWLCLPFLRAPWDDLRFCTKKKKSNLIGACLLFKDLWTACLLRANCIFPHPDKKISKTAESLLLTR